MEGEKEGKGEGEENKRLGEVGGRKQEKER